MNLARTLALTLSLPLAAYVQAEEPFRIFVRDAQTGRGVPLVELKLTNSLKFYTDNNGLVAFNEPGLMNTRVHFTISSHGYEYPADGFGIRGVALNVTPGGSATIDINRMNIAERLYRITGQGQYRDTVLLGEQPPIDNPNINGLVMGQDSIQSIVYNGLIRWFWGDTGRVAYPLGNFGMSGAVSRLPQDGGLDPSVGINLEYFVDQNGFSRPMIDIEGPGPVWCDAFMTIPDGAGRERMVCHWVRVQDLGTLYERGLAVYNDDIDLFERIANLPVDASIYPHAHPVEIEFEGQRHYLFGQPFPNLRMPATMDAFTDTSQYAGFTPLGPDGQTVQRDANGRIVYDWKLGVPPVNATRLRELTNSDKMARNEWWMDTHDVMTGAEVYPHGGSVAWNPHRNRWVAIYLQSFGSPSFLGEIWYAEADTPLGPWGWSQRIVTHNNYSFYNPKHHPFLDQDGGRVIYFEGTYTASFTDNDCPTPRYDYNQIMYRLNLDDPRLHIPAPVCEMRSGTLAVGRDALDDPNDVHGIAFFALRPGDDVPGSIPVYFNAAGDGLTLDQPGPGAEPVFHAWPAAPDGDGPAPDEALQTLHEFTNSNGQHRYSTRQNIGPGWTRNQDPICRVWPSRVAPEVARSIMIHGSQLSPWNDK